MRRAPMTRRLLVSACMLAALGASAPAHADVVDDAFVAGNEAAAQGDWSAAVRHYERARQLLPGRSATLSLNLGLAYGHLGDLGYATYHLERARQDAAQPSEEIVALAERNLAIVRQRAEVEAEGSEARLSPLPEWQDVLLRALAGGWLAWLSLLAGLGLLVTVGVRVARRGSDALTGALIIAFAAVFAIGGSLHAFARSSDRVAPGAIAVGEDLVARAGPGRHQAESFTLQRGARVLELERRGGWVHVRLPPGLEGWVPEGAVASLERADSDVRPRPGLESR